MFSTPGPSLNFTCLGRIQNTSHAVKFNTTSVTEVYLNVKLQNLTAFEYLLIASLLDLDWVPSGWRASAGLAVAYVAHSEPACLVAP